MNKKTFIVLIVLMAIAVALWQANSRVTDGGVAAPPAADAARTPVPLQPAFYQENRFNRAAERARSVVPDPGVHAAIVPHHLVAADAIATLIAGLRQEDITRVIIIGPNHADLNPTTVTAAHLAWETPLGTAETDPEGVASVLSALDVRAYPEAFMNEHSVGALIPFVRQYFPEARIVPVIFNSTAGRPEAERLADWLAANADAHTVILFSLDFSHYETPAAAARYDAVTKEAIEQGMVDRIGDFNQRFLDSRATLMTALLYAERADLAPDIVFEGTANDFLAVPAGEVTTYFGVYWR